MALLGKKKEQFRKIPLPEPTDEEVKEAVVEEIREIPENKIKIVNIKGTDLYTDGNVWTGQELIAFLATQEVNKK